MISASKTGAFFEKKKGTGFLLLKKAKEDNMTQEKNYNFFRELGIRLKYEGSFITAPPFCEYDHSRQPEPEDAGILYPASVGLSL